MNRRATSIYHDLLLPVIWSFIVGIMAVAGLLLIYGTAEAQEEKFYYVLSVDTIKFTSSAGGCGYEYPASLKALWVDGKVEMIETGAIRDFGNGEKHAFVKKGNNAQCESAMTIWKVPSSIKNSSFGADSATIYRITKGTAQTKLGELYPEGIVLDNKDGEDIVSIEGRGAEL